jgi:hypothetical protein
MKGDMSFRDISDGEKWVRGRSTKHKWVTFNGMEADVDNGSYSYSGEETNGVIYAIFTLSSKLDLIIKLCVEAGEIVSIHETR